MFYISKIENSEYTLSSTTSSETVVCNEQVIRNLVKSGKTVVGYTKLWNNHETFITAKQVAGAAYAVVDVIDSTAVVNMLVSFVLDNKLKTPFQYRDDNIFLSSTNLIKLKVSGHVVKGLSKFIDCVISNGDSVYIIISGSSYILVRASVIESLISKLNKMEDTSPITAMLDEYYKGYTFDSTKACLEYCKKHNLCIVNDYNTYKRDTYYFGGYRIEPYRYVRGNYVPLMALFNCIMLDITLINPEIGIAYRNNCYTVTFVRNKCELHMYTETGLEAVIGIGLVPKEILGVDLGNIYNCFNIFGLCIDYYEFRKRGKSIVGEVLCKCVSN